MNITSLNYTEKVPRFSYIRIEGQIKIMLGIICDWFVVVYGFACCFSKK